MSYTQIKLFWNEGKVNFILSLPFTFYSVFIMEILNVYKSRESSLLKLEVWSAASKIINLHFIYTPYVSLLKPQFVLKHFILKYPNMYI